MIQQLITTEDMKRVYQMYGANGHRAFTVVIPDFAYNGMRICLSTDDQSQIPKLISLGSRFVDFFRAAQDKGLLEELKKPTGGRIEIS
jgi:hypothetical protein